MNGNRRDFLRLASAGPAIAMSGIIDRALAIPAAGKTGSIRDVEHIVVHMQENRSFDHYFGMLNGVRGFGDPRPLRLPGGRSVWSQPSGQHPDGYVMPFHGDSRTTRSFLVDGADQSHVENMHIFHRGRYDRWGHTAELHNRMLHYGPGDLPFYYALANAFTVCDAYHCSTMTQTYPNRLHLFTGCNGGGTVGGDPQMHNYGEDETPSADMATDRPLDPAAYGWTTYAERLQAAGIDWKVYQEYDNFGDNLLSVFAPFRPCAKDSELYRRGRSWVSEQAGGQDRTRSDGEQLVAAFRRDIESGNLPQISWIVTAAELSEHPKAEPSRGEHVTARLVEALIDNPDVFARTVFILNYDEAGGFYDHVPPPVPPVGTYRGKSTVPLDGEAKDYRGSGQAGDERHPIGLGIRTPTVIVSPWSRGGHVCSELFDHTSVLRFMEKRFGVREPNISAWRRAVCGDLTSAFDFSGGRSPPARSLPDTDDFRERVARSAAGTANAIPARQAPTAQMPGQRAHRPLPYRIAADSHRDADGRLVLAMANQGATGAVLTVHDNRDFMEPRHYTIGAGGRIDDIWEAEGDSFDLTLHGPNGFWRRFAGSLAKEPHHRVSLVDRPELDAAELRLENRGAAPLTFHIALGDAYPAPAGRNREVIVAPGETVADLWRLAKSDNWYDLSVTPGSDEGALWHYAGKVENGRPGRTDPAIGVMRV
ncbi:phosphocholine-specific phospholipase C [Novosphingobium album (ex Liu et al. 2023)]|uniref:phospholipase C n=1 Tax=Novosphingobium album (ex Liu et al. 2023) TaxID=3031130 RepID=A0ABT5WP16_9SPHN|nr:phospholipase C, phosphocholine-specific [Novosphingobium album (ex Liu et al. 2023)]MDE8651012.1 phospholipase C, phosphocholine-specific [Novosphingobium album (ex Liu et al. 2023)]